MHTALDSALSQDDRRQLEDHLAGCATCRAEQESLRSLDRHLAQDLRGQWPRRSLTQADLARIARKVDAGSRDRRPGFSLSFGWLRSAAQVAAIAALAAVMVWVLGAVSRGGSLSPGQETGTVTPEVTTPAPEAACQVTLDAPLDILSGPGAQFAAVGAAQAGAQVIVTGRLTDDQQHVWLAVTTADGAASGWVDAAAAQGQGILAACPALPVVTAEAPTPTLTPSPTGTDLPTDTPSPTPSPTSSPTPTVTPTTNLRATETPTPPSPTVSSTATPQTAPATQNPPPYQAAVGCAKTTITGSTVMTAASVKVTVTLASNLLSTLASVVVDVTPDGRFTAALDYAAQPAGTRLIVAFGEWDGAKFMRPATLFGEDCSG